jgi:orotate phosphoribosyltransferase
MEQYKQDFIAFMVRSRVLTFGDFTTKSGRKTPYFINTGNYTTGAQMVKLGSFYAQAIHAGWDNGFNVLFGPAYKGIPLVIAASMALFQTLGQDIAYCYNRKEAKDHGEGGSLVGYCLRDNDRVLIVEDVITAGTSIKETAPQLLSAAKVKLAGLIVSVDRMEKGSGEVSALKEVSETYKMPVRAIVTLDEIVEYLYNRELDGSVLINDSVRARIQEYRSLYGVKS